MKICFYILFLLCLYTNLVKENKEIKQSCIKLQVFTVLPISFSFAKLMICEIYLLML